MIDLLLQFGISNLLLSAALAATAWAVQARGKRPMLAHLLWLLVLAKLITPPLWSVSMVTLPGASPSFAEWSAELATSHPEAFLADGIEGPAVLSPGKVLANGQELGAGDPAARAWIAPLKLALVLLWAIGSLVVLGWSLLRIVRFHRLLRQASLPAPVPVVKLAAELAGRLGLGRTPTVQLTGARMSPMVWWVGGRVRVILPEHLLQEVDAKQLRWVLAHELGHVRRRDHLVRWLEWLACVAFWWNPVAWWARRNLRAHEEICCDALVLRSLGGERRSYATSLLAVVESLTAPVLRPPAIASALTSGGFLERRFQMILSKNPLPVLPRRLQALVLACAVALLPFGVAQAQEPNYDAVTKRLRAAIEAGELTGPQARVMLQALRQNTKAAPRASAQRDREPIPVRADDPRLERYRIYQTKLKAAVAAGQISREDAGKKLEAAKRQLFAPEMQYRAQAERERVAEFRSREYLRDEEVILRKERLQMASQELRAAVDAGRISSEDAQKRLDEMRQRLFPEVDRSTDLWLERSRGVDRSTDLWLERSRGVEQNGNSGEPFFDVGISPAWLERVKTYFGGEGGMNEKQVEIAMSAMLRTLPAMLEQGENYKLDPELARVLTLRGFTREQIALIEGMARGFDPERRLKGTRSREGDSEARERATDIEEGEDPRVKRYRAFQATIKDAVASGRMTPEEAEEELIAVRKRMFGRR